MDTPRTVTKAPPEEVQRSLDERRQLDRRGDPLGAELVEGLDASSEPFDKAQDRFVERLETPLRMTYEEFLAWSDEDVHAEWVDGEVIVFMPPMDRHQDIVGFIHVLLRLFVDFFQLGKVRTAPFEMKVSPDSPAREPDLLFVARENLERLTEKRLVGPADLILEMISDDSVERDRVTKFCEYQEAGVREYWIIDPRPGKERADFFVLDDQGRYRPVLIGDDGIYRSTVIPGFWLRVDWLWAEELPDPQRTFAEIVGPSRLMEALRDMVNPDARPSKAAEARRQA
jgi:Uma2 family endonuclease